MRTFDLLDLTAPDVVVGQHSAWLPALGIKVPFQWGGRLQKYRKRDEPSYPLGQLAGDVALLDALAEARMAPPVGEFVYFKTVVSEHPGAWWADPLGAYGYVMADAARLPPGRFTPDALRRWAVGRVQGSPGAWGDLAKPGNAVNGYLVDVRRSGFDLLRWVGPGPRRRLPTYTEDAEALAADLTDQGDFPLHQRHEAYQEYYLAGRWQPGARQVRERAERLEYLPNLDETVLDIGCHTGGFLALAASYQTAMTPCLVGIDVEPLYLDLARRLARANGQNICHRRADVGVNYSTDGVEDRRSVGAAPIDARVLGLNALVEWLAALWPRGIDHCLALSLTKHLPGTEARLWRVVDAIGARTTYLESNGTRADCYPLRDEVVRRGGVHVGDSTDRNLRRLYRVPGGAVAPDAAAGARSGGARRGHVKEDASADAAPG